MDNTIIVSRKILDEVKLDKNTKRIEELAGYGNCLCIAYNNKKMQYIRTGSDGGAGNEQQDIFKIDNEGNLLNDIQWDFDYISKIILIPIPDVRIRIQNGNFITNISNDEYEQTNNNYMERNILVTRSNCEIKNINHTLSDNNKVFGPYHGFLEIKMLCDVDVRDCKLTAHKYVEQSSYDLILEYSSNVKFENVISDDINNINRWGITGTNYTKDITYSNCILNRIDVHCGVYNLNINNCQIGIKGIEVVGAGTLNIESTTINAQNALVYLRGDYGSTWNGTINVKDCQLKNITQPNLFYFMLSYNNNGEIHDYGYPLCLPNVNVDGLTIDDDKIDKSVKSIYLFFNTKDRTKIENGDISNIYQLPKNIVLKDVETKSGRDIKIFYNDINGFNINN